MSWKVIERPKHVRAIPARLVEEDLRELLHQERSLDGQRCVFDLFEDTEIQDIVQRGINMKTGKVLWFRLEPGPESSRPLP